MNFIYTLVATPAARTLGWSLFHFLWEGAAIAVLLAAALYACRGGSARLRYAIACTALLAMPLAFAITFVVSQPSAPRLIPPVPVLKLAPSVAVSASTPIPDAPMPLRERLRWAAPFWMAGVLLFYLRSLGGWMAARRLRIRGVCAAPDPWQARLRALATRLRVTRPVVLLESCLAETPLVIGFVRPVVLMPVGLLAGLTTEQVEAILIHELAHIRRYDYCVTLAQSVIEGLLFYHPAVWWISSVVRTERENCCDDVVVATRGDARGYAEALARLEQARWQAAEPALAATGGSLLRRIRRLLCQPEGPRAVAAPLFSAGLIALTVAAALSAWPSPPQQTQSPAQPARPPEPMDKERKRKQTAPARDLSVPQNVAQTLEQFEQTRQESMTPYRKWLSDDVAYIITNEERAAYRSLQTDSERERFIEQFWLRRDPTPGTALNEMKEEHYRRIAYANVHFVAATLAGWKTDRGRVYISYGPPDELESHPDADPPNEQWLYHHIEGIGDNVIIEFTDPTRLGEYRMTADPNGVKVTMPLPGPGPNVFVENVDWSAVPAEVHRPRGAAPKATLITVPIDGGSAIVYIRIATSKGQTVAAAQDRVENRSLYHAAFDLPPGSYRVTVGTRHIGSTASPATRTTTFEVR